MGKGRWPGGHALTRHRSELVLVTPDGEDRKVVPQRVGGGEGEGAAVVGVDLPEDLDRGGLVPREREVVLWKEVVLWRGSGRLPSGGGGVVCV